VGGKKRLALEKESIWGIYRGNLDEKLQRYREKQRMFLAFFFAENVCRLGSEKKISSVHAYLLCFLHLRIFDNVELSKTKNCLTWNVGEG
jgi:hypothetical protein